MNFVAVKDFCLSKAGEFYKKLKVGISEILLEKLEQPGLGGGVPGHGRGWKGMISEVPPSPKHPVSLSNSLCSSDFTDINGSARPVHQTGIFHFIHHLKLTAVIPQTCLQAPSSFPAPSNSGYFGQK